MKKVLVVSGLPSTGVPRQRARASRLLRRERIEKSLSVDRNGFVSRRRAGAL